jgi:hypothetical protein
MPFFSLTKSAPQFNPASVVAVSLCKQIKDFHMDNKDLHEENRALASKDAALSMGITIMRMLHREDDPVHDVDADNAASKSLSSSKKTEKTTQPRTKSQFQK